ncbi:hypothetical protein MX633_11175 [Carnobacterium divergens]|uniref:hypothetical protein n=1 Tax=Carnobacterium divergens TaxID=2748 RepID=UPI002891F9A9|nr:hypothetical protein [Carnobacterium divergens]MDT1997227.1 hypothetical protein [Carnobacterium divergens]
MNEISKYYRDPTHITEENWVEVFKISGTHKTLAAWIREKMYGIDVREALARLVEQMSSDLYDDRQIAIALDKLAKELQEKWDNDTQKIIDEWKNTIGGVTVDSELINARIDLHGIVYKTLKERLDDMQSKIENLDATESVFTLNHNQNCYPTLRVFYSTYGAAVVPSEEEPMGAGGSEVNYVHAEPIYHDLDSMTVKVPFKYKMVNPTIERISENQYLLVEDIRTLLVEIGSKGEANVETTMEFTSTLDYKNKVAKSDLENPNVAKWVHNTDLLSPDNSKYNELNQAYYNLLVNSSFVINSVVSKARAIALINFNLYEDFKRKFPSAISDGSLEQNVQKFRLIFKSANWGTYSKGSNGIENKSTMRIWNQTAWVVPRENKTDKLAKLQDYTVNPVYIDGRGMLNLIVYSEQNDGTVNSVLEISKPIVTYAVTVPFAPIK